LVSLAEAKGVSVDDLLLEVINDLELAQNAASESSLVEFEEDMDALAEGLENVPVRYEGNYSREDIYIDHD